MANLIIGQFALLVIYCSGGVVGFNGGSFIADQLTNPIRYQLCDRVLQFQEKEGFSLPTPGPVTSYPVPSCTHAGACGETLTNHSGYIQSPKEQGRYCTSLSCLWTVQAPAGYKIRITAQEFDTEECCDVVRVYGIEDGDVALSGQTSDEFSFASISNTLQLTFHSDSSISKSGFKFYYHIFPGDVMCDEAVIVLEAPTTDKDRPSCALSCIEDLECAAFSFSIQCVHYSLSSGIA